MVRANLNEFVENQILLGNAWQVVSGQRTVTSAAPVELLLVTGADEVLIVNAKVVASGDNIIASGYREAVATGGTPVTLSNKNDVINGSPKTTAFFGPTVTSVGAVMNEVASFGSNQTPERNISLASVAEQDLYVLKPNSKYLLRVSSSGTSNVYFTLTFVESNYMD